MNKGPVKAIAPDPGFALKQQFVRQLAVYLVENQALRSVGLELGDQHAREWSALRWATPLHGYPTVDEAERTLAAWLGIPLAPRKRAAAKAGGRKR